MRALPVGGDVAARPDGLRVAMRRSLEWFVFGVLPALIFCWWVVFAVVQTDDNTIHWAFDTRQYWQGGSDVIDRASPYASTEAVAAAPEDIDSAGILETFRFTYPAAAAVAFAPFALIGFDAAAAIWAILLVGSILGALWILGVRDWRVAGVVFGSAPVISSVVIGTMTPVLLLLLALAWRWRDRAWLVGSALGVAIALKLFLWPLVVWLAATRRWTAALVAAGVAAATTLGAWAAIGFDGFTDYPEILRRLADIVGVRGFSLVAFGDRAGLPEVAAEALPFVVGAALLALVVSLGRRRDEDRAAFSVAVVAALALTPIVWAHYFALLVAPLALARPRLSWAWGVMWVFWLVPAQENGGDLWRVVVALAMTAALVLVAARTSSRRAA